jgi:hypothetical protein
MTATLRFNRYVGPDGGSPNGPGGHAVEVGIAAWDDAGHPVWVDAPLLPFHLGPWDLATVLRRFRGNRTAVCYGDAFAVTEHGFPADTLGIQSEAFAADRYRAAIRHARRHHDHEGRTKRP